MAQDTIVKTDSVRTAILTNLNGDIAELFTAVAGKAAAAHTHGGAGTVSFTIGTNASRLLASPTADLIWYADDTGIWWFYDFSITTWSQLVASATVPGVVELATDAEVVTGTDTARAVTPANLQAKLDDEALLKADGTAGRTIRTTELMIDDGTNAATLKCDLTTVWNGHTIAETDNVAKGATTGNFTLDATGYALKIEASGLDSTNCVAVLSAVIGQNLSTTEITVSGKHLSNDIYLRFFNTATGGTVDLTTLVDTGRIHVNIAYITDA